MAAFDELAYDPVAFDTPTAGAVVGTGSGPSGVAEIPGPSGTATPVGLTGTATIVAEG